MHPTSIAQLWQGLHDWAEVHQPARLRRLNPGASEADIAALGDLGLPLPQDFLDSLRVHDGEDSAECGRLFPGGATLLPAQDMIAARQELLALEDEFPDGPDADDEGEPRVALGAVKPWSDSSARLPFMRQEEFLWLLDFDPAEGGSVGQVIRCDTAGRSEWMVCAEGFAAFLADYLAALRGGEIEAEEFDAVEGDLYDDAEDVYEEADGVEDIYPDFLDQDEDEDDEQRFEPREWQPLAGPWPPVERLPWLSPDNLTPERLRLLGRSGRWIEALELSLGLAPPLNPQEAIRFRARALRERGRSEEALDQLQGLFDAGESSEDDLLLRLDLLEDGGETERMLAESSLAIEAGAGPRLLARRARLWQSIGGEPPFEAAPAEAITWLGSPAGQQHTATCRERAVDDLRRALAREDRIAWRIRLADCLLESERWDEALATCEVLIERLRSRGETGSQRMQHARAVLDQARRRELDETPADLLGSMDELLEAMRGYAERHGGVAAGMDEIGALRDAFAQLVDDGHKAQQQMDADPDMIEREAEEIAQQLARQHLDTPERFAPYPADELDGPTKRWLQQARRELEAFGFHHLATVEPLRNTEVSGQRVALDVLLGDGGRCVAAVWRLQAPQAVYEVVDFESELGDGRILVTNNSGAANPFQPPPLIEQLALPLGTDIANLRAAHARRVAAAASPAQRLPDLDAVLALQERQRQIKREHARGLGWISDGDLRGLLGGAHALLGARVRARLVAILG